VVTFRRLLRVGVPFLGAIVYNLIRAVVSRAVGVWLGEDLVP